MSCLECDRQQADGQGFYIRIDNTDILAHACATHFAKLQMLLKKARRKEPEKEREETLTLTHIRMIRFGTDSLGNGKYNVIGNIGTEELVVIHDLSKQEAMGYIANKRETRRINHAGNCSSNRR